MGHTLNEMQTITNKIINDHYKKPKCISNKNSNDNYKTKHYIPKLPNVFVNA